MNHDIPPPSASSEDMTDNATSKPVREPMLNVPPMTLALVVLLVVCHLVFWYAPPRLMAFFMTLPFVPEDFSRNPLRWSYTLLTYAMLHGGWAHLGVNVAGLMAFGSGIERMLGKRFLLGIFIGGSIAGTLGYWAVFPHGLAPLIGASGGISALFGGILPLIVRRPQWLMASILFIVVNIVLGMIGVPHDPVKGATFAIAWQAHIAGFLFGEAVIILWIRNRISRFKNRDSKPQQDPSN